MKPLMIKTTACTVILYRHLNVSVCYLVVVQVLESLQDLPRVEANGGLVVFQRAPLGSQQRRQTPWTPWDETQQGSVHSV